MTWQRFLSCLVVVLVLGPLPALADDLTICSFNIQFLGNPTRRDDVALASSLADYDIVVAEFELNNEITADSAEGYVANDLT